MRRRHLVCLIVAAVAVFGLCATPALAQSAAAAKSTSTNFFRAFFWPVVDEVDFAYIFGLLQIWLLIMLSAISVGYMIQLGLRFRRTTLLPQSSVDQLSAMLNEKRYREAIEFSEGDPSYIGKLVNGALKEAANGYAGMERAVEEVSDAETTRYLRPVEWLNLLGNVAPMLGLFGTVYGMIVAFSKLVTAGGRPDPAALAGGISTALVTTFWGLVVAMPALSAYSIIRNRIDALTSEGLLQAEELIKTFKPGHKPKPATAAKEAPKATAKPRPTA